MIVYHHLPLYFHFLKLLLTFLLFPADMTGNVSYRTFSPPMFLVGPVGKKTKPQTETNYRSFILESYI